MKPERLDRRITIQEKTVTQSPSGAIIETWSNIAERRSASMRAVKGDERFVTPQEIATDDIEFVVRYSQSLVDLSPLNRIIHPALDTGEGAGDAQFRRIHDVLAVQEIGRREGLRIITRRRPDVLFVEEVEISDGLGLRFLRGRFIAARAYKILHLGGVGSAASDGQGLRFLRSRFLAARAFKSLRDPPA